MSELTICNYCQLKRMQEKAKAKNGTVILEYVPDDWITARYSYEDKPSAGFAVLTAHCVC